jgi:hypothetical protein
MDHRGYGLESNERAGACMGDVHIGVTAMVEGMSFWVYLSNDTLAGV